MRAKTDNSAQKLRGGFYTPPALARLLADWIAQTPVPGPLRCLEPSCGDGNLVRALAAVQRPVSLDAWELDPDAADAAADDVAKLGTLHRGDYLVHAARNPDAPAYDAVIGNPPYIRYQYLPPDTRSAITERLAHAGVHATRHANAWLGFVVDAVDRLRRGGRVALVLPAELLQVQYTADVRRFLLERLEVLDLHTFTRPLFDGVLQEVLVLLGQAGPGPCTVRVLERDTPLDPLPDPPALPVQDTDETEKWTRYWLDADARADWERLRALAVPFDQLATVEVGIVTGANRFFCVDDPTVQEHSLQSVALPLLGRSAQAKGLRLTDADHSALVEAGERAWLLHFPPTPLEQLPPAWQRLLRQGEAQGLHRRYKCRIREPWYRVPAVWPAEICLFKRCHAATRLLHNQAGAVTTDTVYRVGARDPDRTRALVASFCNSLTWVSVELNGRSYGGGVLELVPTEIRRLRLPDVLPPPALLDELDALWRDGAPPLAILEHADPFLLGPLGISTAEQTRLRALWQRLSGRRLSRAGRAS